MMEILSIELQLISPSQYPHTTRRPGSRAPLYDPQPDDWIHIRAMTHARVYTTVGDPSTPDLRPIQSLERSALFRPFTSAGNSPRAVD
ncbi:hypothetical protein PM082_001577 [Marasmius tenuissimus]|nr:hypothetical protein PM082_001577 [Marasmius tenuissimus]